MNQINGIEDFLIIKPSIVTIGTFDGVHLGHQKILSKLVSEGKKSKLETVVLTFFPHPRKILNPSIQLSLLNTQSEKIELFKSSGIDNLITQKFNKDFSEYSAEKYVQKILFPYSEGCFK